MGTNEKPREEKINNPLCVALNTILCGQESGGFVKCMYVCTCANPHTNAAEGSWNRAESAAEMDDILTKLCAVKEMCRWSGRWWFYFEGVKGLRLGGSNSPEALR